MTILNKISVIPKEYYMFLVIAIIFVYFIVKSTEHLVSDCSKDSINNGYTSWIFGGIPSITSETPNTTNDSSLKGMPPATQPSNDQISYGNIRGSLVAKSS